MISFAVEYIGHNAPYHNQGIADSDTISYGDDDDEKIEGWPDNWHEEEEE